MKYFVIDDEEKKSNLLTTYKVLEKKMRLDVICLVVCLSTCRVKTSINGPSPRLVADIPHIQLFQARVTFCGDQS